MRTKFSNLLYSIITFTAYHNLLYSPVFWFSWFIKVFLIALPNYEYSIFRITFQTTYYL